MLAAPLEAKVMEPNAVIQSDAAIADSRSEYCWDSNPKLGSHNAAIGDDNGWPLTIQYIFLVNPATRFDKLN